MSQDLTCLNFPGRNYTQKETIIYKGRIPWGDQTNKNAVNPGINFFPEWTAYHGYCHSPGQCSGSECDCSEGTLNSFGVSDLGGAVWKGAGDCGGGSNWGCCGCAIMSWNQDPTNKSQCCDPLGSPIQGSEIHCDPGWCPFSPQCEHDSTTSQYCKNNVDDLKCLNICMKYSTKEAVTTYNTTHKRPDFCDEYMKNYCIKHQNDSADNQDLCSCITSDTPNVICVSEKCQNAGNAWVSDQMYSRQANCGTICQAYINAQTNDGNIDINGNDFKMACGNSGSGGGGGANNWWSWATGSQVVSPGVTPPDTITQHWWGHWTLSTNANGQTIASRSFSPQAIIGVVIAGLIVLTIILALMRRIIFSSTPIVSPSTSPSISPK